MELLSEVLIQPVINIIQSWENILNGNIASVANIDYVETDGYAVDYQNIKHDFQMIGCDIKQAMKEFNNERGKQG